MQLHSLHLVLLFPRCSLHLSEYIVVTKPMPIKTAKLKYCGNVTFYFTRFHLWLSAEISASQHERQTSDVGKLRKMW